MESFFQFCLGLIRFGALYKKLLHSLTRIIKRLTQFWKYNIYLIVLRTQQSTIQLTRILVKCFLWTESPPQTKDIFWSFLLKNKDDKAKNYWMMMAKDRNVTFFSAAFFYLGKKRPQKYDDVHEFSDSDVALISFIQNFFIRIIFLYFQMLHL